MKVTAVPGPGQAPQPSAGLGQAMSARDKAIAALVGDTAQPKAAPAPVTQAEVDSILKPKAVDTSAPEESEEVQAAEVTEEVAKDTPISRQFAELARQEKQLQAKQAAIKAREAAIAEREAKASAEKHAPGLDMSKYIDRQALMRDPLTVLAEAGLTYDQLTEQLLNPQQTDPRVMAQMEKLQAKLDALEAADKERSEKMTQAEQQQYQTAVKQIEADAKKMVYTDERFETIKETNSVKDVVELITQTFNETGELLTVEEAAQQVEDYLTEQALKLAKISKIQKRLQPSPEKAEALQAKSEQPKPAQSQMKTLTNAASTQRQLTAKERAMLAFRGEKF